VVEMLNILENFELAKQDRWSPQTMHLMVEAMRRAFCDRARYLGDADFVKIPPHLTSKDYARTLAQEIRTDKATPSADLAKDIPLAGEGDSTTHFSVIDKDGMAVSNTYTLEQSYGSRVVVKGAGFLLNDDSQTPTIVARNGKVVLVTGSPGSRTIINTVLCILVNVLDYHMDIRAAVDAPRLHHAWFPDVVRFEGMSEHAASVERLRQMGHKVEGTRQGDAHSIWVDPSSGQYFGAEDRRIRGKASGY
jgi:gamma-glutamyltranspeptidase/glutathione hydrolase